MMEWIFRAIELFFATFFSWSLYKLNKRGQDLSKEIADRDAKKDQKEIAKIAIEITQVLKYNFFTLLQKYNVNNKRGNLNFSEFILIEDWIGKVGTLTDILSTSEINDLYKLYLEIEKFSKNTMKNSNDSVKNMVEEIFQNQFLEYSFYIEKVDYRLFLKKKYLDILKKIEGKYIVVNNCLSEYIKMEKGLKESLPEGYSYEGNEYTDSLYFGEELIMYNLEMERFNITSRIFIDNNNKKSGYNTELDRNSKIKYSGNIIKGKKNGIGKEYENGKLKFNGIFEKGQYKEGTYLSNNSAIVYFQGLYKNGIPSTGEIKIKGFDNHFDSWIKDFEGEIKEGKYFNGIGKKCTRVMSAQKSDSSQIEKLEIESIQECNEAYSDYIYDSDHNEIPDEVLEEQYRQDEKNISELNSDYLMVYEALEYKNGNKKSLPDKKSYLGVNVSEFF